MLGPDFGALIVRCPEVFFFKKQILKDNKRACKVSQHAKSSLGA